MLMNQKQKDIEFRFSFGQGWFDSNTILENAIKKMLTPIAEDLEADVVVLTQWRGDLLAGYFTYLNNSTEDLVVRHIGQIEAPDEDTKDHLKRIKEYVLTVVDKLFPGEETTIIKPHPAIIKPLFYLDDKIDPMSLKIYEYSFDELTEFLKPVKTKPKSNESWRNRKRGFSGYYSSKK